VEAFLQQINLPELIASLVGFLIFMAVMYKALWKPVLGTIDERRESIEAAFQEVDTARADVARMKSELETRLAQINSEAQTKMQEAVDRGQQISAEIKAAAEEQREKLLARTAEDIQREKEIALAEMRNVAVDLSFDITQRVLKQNLDKSAHERLVASFTDDLSRLN
jgi:F-type H+-transporting ATPase subunit b